MPAASFEKATAEVKQLAKKPEPTDQLQLYGLYKVAREEDFSKASRPGNPFDVEGKYKYDQWKKEVESGMTPAEAQKKYVELVGNFKSKYGYSG